LSLSVVIITLNEEANLVRTLQSVAWADEIVIVDSRSTDHTRDIAEFYHAKFFVESWKGFAAQKNSALQKATGDWILSLDADEDVESALAEEIRQTLAANPSADGFWIPRKNFFLGRWIRHGGFYPDRKLRLFRRDAGQFEERLVHEDVRITGTTARLKNNLLHRAYPTLEGYLEHMNRYSSLGAQMMAGGKIKPVLPTSPNNVLSEKTATLLEHLNAELKKSQEYETGGIPVVRRGSFSFLNIVIRPRLTFFYNYILRGGFLDGHEGLLLHLYHADYVSWKYAKAWERSHEFEA
jgi:glycosyltransferase involved in cell wall biosynthesis